MDVTHSTAASPSIASDEDEDEDDGAPIPRCVRTEAVAIPNPGSAGEEPEREPRKKAGDADAADRRPAAAEERPRSHRRRLAFFSGKLYGRERECAELLSAFRGLVDADRRDGRGGSGSEAEGAAGPGPAIVALSGPSGAGKTALAESLAIPAGRAGGAFVRGKFDEMRRTQPYSAFGCALTGLCGRILGGGTELAASARDSIREAIGESWRTVRHIVPNLGEVMTEPGPARSRSVSSEGTEGGDVNIARENFHLLVQMFIQATARLFPAVVLFLDDLQWADLPSVDLFQTLASGTDIPSLMIVLSYRSDELKEDDPLLAHLDKLRSRGVAVTDIAVGPLAKGAVNDLVSDTLGMPPERTRPLAELVFSKARGNCLHSIHFLKMLLEERLLRFSDADESRSGWTWDEGAIRRHPIPDGMAELVSRRIQLLPDEVRCFLKMVSCLGTQFDATLLELLGKSNLVRQCKGSGADSSPQALVELAIREGFVERAGTNTYRFSHDRIALGAYSLIDAAEVDGWHYRIGESLRTNSSPEQLNAILFVAADQLNRGSSLIGDAARLADLARLNLRAGRKAASSSAFIPAASYFRAGIHALERRSGGDHWAGEYDLSLRLHQAYAECAYSVGLFDAVDATLETVFAHVKSKHDRIDGYKTLIRSFVARNRLEEAVATGLDIARDLGQPFPRKVGKATILADLVKTKLALRGKSKEDILSLRDMTDQDKVDTMEVLGIIFLCAYLSRVEYIPLISFRMIRLSLSYGRHDATPFGFVLYAMLLCCAMGRHKEGYRYGQIALSLLDRSKTMRWHANVYVYFYALTSHFGQPQIAGIKPLLNAYNIGMRAGCIDDALLAAHARCMVQFHSCQPLDQVDANFRTVNQSLLDHGQDATRRSFVLMWQVVLNLWRGSANPTEMKGEAMNEEEFDLEALKNDHTAVTYFHFFRLVLAVIYGYDDLAIELAEKSRAIATLAVGSFSACKHPFYEGLAAVAMARKTKEAKWRKLAGRCKKRIKSFDSLSSGNFLHMFLLLKAECASLKSSKPIALFDAAIAAAKENGYIGDEALANEKAGAFLLTQFDETKAEEYLTAAVKCYTKWKALGKVDQMTRKYGIHLLKDDAVLKAS